MLKKIANWLVGAPAASRGCAVLRAGYDFFSYLLACFETVVLAPQRSLFFAVRILTVGLLIGSVAPAHAFFFGGKKDEEAEAVRDPTPYVATLNAGGGALEKKLKAASSLIGDVKKVPSGTVGLLSRARDDQQRLIGTLYQEGHYGGTVSFLVNGTSYDRVPIDTNLRGGEPAEVVINVDPGPLFTFGQISIKGADGQSPPPEKFGLVSGKPARSSLILKAEKKLVDDWRDRGHPFAKAAKRRIKANHASRQLNVAITIIAGPQANFGVVDVRGARDVDPAFIARQTAIPVGALYDPRMVRRAEKRLRELQVFDSIVISEADRLASDGSIPILVTVNERKPRVIGAGITASNTDGIGLEAYWMHRNLFGSGERLRFEGSINRIGEASDIDELGYRGAMLFSKPGFGGPATTLNSKFVVEQEVPDAFRKRAVSGAVGITHDFTDKLSASIGTEVEYAKIRDVTGEETFLLAGVPLKFEYDTRDSTLDPTRGIRTSATFEPIYDFENSRGFFIGKSALSAYKSVGPAKRVVLAGRVAGGTVQGADLTDIPADRRFYAGGGGSIRGYAYQAASPRVANGDLLGGRSFVETSLEVRFKITEKIGLVPFIDAGGAFTTAQPSTGNDFFVGAGLGLRYLTPVGPLRLDVAVPLDDIPNEPDFGIYVGLGQAF